MDKKSFIRWKQRDIHEKREQRKMQLAGLRAERETNGTLGPMIDEVREERSEHLSPRIYWRLTGTRSSLLLARRSSIQPRVKGIPSTLVKCRALQPTELHEATRMARMVPRRTT